MKLTLQACYIPTEINLKKVRERYADRCPKLSDPLQMCFDENRCAYISSFGAVVFWPDDTEIVSRVLTDLKPFIGEKSYLKEVSDQLVVSTEMAESKVLFDEIWLEGIPSFDQKSVIAQLFARSVALEHLRLEVDDALDSIQTHVTNLRDRGRLAISDIGAFRKIGFAMDIRHRVLTSLALFDKPAAVWESENLETLYTKLYNLLDLEERHRTIARKLTFISDNTSFLYEFISTRKSHQLEWIIIVLIAFEIILFVFSELFLK